MKFQAVDCNAYIRSQLHSILSPVPEISVVTLSATTWFQGKDFHNKTGSHYCKLMIK